MCNYTQQLKITDVNDLALKYHQTKVKGHTLMSVLLFVHMCYTQY